MTCNKCILLICGFILLCFVGNAQQAYLRHFSVNDGLPSNNVYDVYSDSQGYLWFGTDKGIARYNGITFDYFTTSDGLPDNDVFSFMEDKQHRLWISTNSKALCYYKDNRFYTPQNTPFLKLPFKSVQTDIAIAADSTITMFFSEREGKFVSIRGNRLTLHDFSKIEVKANEKLLKVLRIPHKGYKLLYSHEWVEIDNEDRFIKRYKSAKDFTPVYTRTGDRQLLYAGKYIYDTDEKQLQHVSDNVEEYKGYIIARYEPHRTFICTGNGLFVNNIHLLPQDHVVALSPDIDGNYWLTTINEGGAYCLNKDLLAVKEYKNTYRGKVTYAKNIGEKIFLANNNGDLYSLINGNISQIYINKKAGDKVKKGFSLMSVITNDGNYFMFSRKDIVWINGINEEKKSVAKIKPPPEIEWIKYVVNFNKNLCYLVRDSIYIVSPFPNQYGGRTIKKITQGGVTSFAIDPQNNLWVATLEGLRKLYHNNILVHSQITAAFRQFGFYNGCILGYTDKNQLLLIKNYDNAHPYIDTLQSDKSIWDGIYPIDTNHIIISSNDHYRLCSFSSTYSKGYKVSFIENAFIPAHADFITADSVNCYFFKDNNITTIKKSTLFETRPPPRVLFTRIKTQLETFSVDSIVSISYASSRDIRIEFDYIAYNSKEIHCQYAITTSDNIVNWKDVDGETAINLLNIGYGRYEIKLRAKTLSSDYSIVRHFILNVERPFWARWWFIAVCILCFLIVVTGVVILVIRYLLRKKQEKYTTEMKVRKSEFKALNALMNPHFIFNSLNNIQSLINKNDVDEANRYLIIFSKLVRQNMHNIDHEYISLDKEILLVRNYLKLEQLRFKELLNYDILLEVPDEELEEIIIPALLLQPLVENAIKHGLQPKQSSYNHLLLRVYEQGNLLIIEIKDNGIGLIKLHDRLTDTNHKSFALSNIQQRIDYFNSLYSQKITFSLQEIVKDEIVKGTLATIKITLD